MDARNFRPVGHLYFRIMSGAFGLDFRKYLLPLHLLHLLNVFLLWLVLRNVGASPFAAGARLNGAPLGIAPLDGVGHPHRALGAAVVSFGFLPSGR